MKSVNKNKFLRITSPKEYIVTSLARPRTFSQSEELLLILHFILLTMSFKREP